MGPMMSTLVTRIYLDYNATHPLLPDARQAMVEVADVWGNPSSLHAEGRRARGVIERARTDVAALLGGDRYGVVFTSGGTESDQLGILGLARVAVAAGRPKVVATTAIEHPAVAGAVAQLQSEGWQVLQLPLDGGGAVQAGGDWATAVGLLAISLVNHELGTIQPISALASQARAAGAFVHVDAVQAAGRMEFGTWLTSVDAVAISAHKIGGPKGVGALWLNAGRAGVDNALPLVVAGHQERGRRSGTENTMAIAGFAAAARASTMRLAAWSRVTALGAQLEAGLRAIPNVSIHGSDTTRVGGTINAGFAGARGEAIVMALDVAGIAASTGAACTSGSVKPSAVLLGIGLDEAAARSAVRFSVGHETTDAEIQRVVDVLPSIVARARTQR